MAKLVLVASATILGAALRYVIDPVSGAALLFVLWALAWVMGRGADRLVRTRPVMATWLYESGWLLVLATVAGSAFLATQLGLWVPSWVAKVPADEQKALAGVILGALSSLIGAAWLDNARKGEGSLWPEARHKAALGNAFLSDSRLVFPRDADMEKLYAAVYLSPDRVNGIGGWSLADRLARARVVEVYGRF